MARVDLLKVGLIAAVAAVAAVLVASFPTDALAQLFHDDSFFAIKTAHNISRGLGSTFDGVNPTNGYHPLYVAWLAALSKVTPLTGGRGVLAVIVTDLAMTAAGLLLLDALLKAAGTRVMPRLFAAAATFAALGLNDFGMEARLLFPLAWLLFYLVYRLKLAGPTDDGPIDRPLTMIATSAVAAAVCLTRLDTVLLVGPLCLYAALPADRPWRAWRVALVRFALLFGPAAVALALFALFNYLSYSHAATVSSWLKAGMPTGFRMGRAWDGMGTLSRMAFSWVMCAAFLLALAATALSRRRTPVTVHPADRVLALACAYALAYSPLLVVFSRVGVGSWYFVIPLSVAIAATARLWDRWLVGTAARLLPAAAVRAAEAAVVVLAVAGGAEFWRRKFAAKPKVDALAMAAWMRQNLPADARVYQVDAAGFTGYFSERSVINGDGLINGWEYQRYLRDGRLVEYLDKHGVEYVLYDEWRGEAPGDVKVPVLLWTEPAHVLSFSETPEVVHSTQVYILLKPKPGTIVVTRPAGQ